MEGGVVALTNPGKELVPVRASMLPFEQLPNLPKPIVPEIDLGIKREDVLAIELPGISSQRRVGFFLSDHSCQTELSDILDLKAVNNSIGILLQDVAKLRKDLNFAQSVMKADYENKLNERATALYCHANERLTELERQHREKIEIVRKSYRTQLSNAIHKIAGEYKTYYDELLQGKTGRHDLKIKELKQRLEIQELKLEESAQTVVELTERLKQYEDDLERKESDIPPPPPPGISMEEADEMRQNIERLEEEMVELRAELAAKEDANNQLTCQVGSLSRQLEDERAKTAQLKRDMENFKKKAKAEQEKAARMAENQMAALQKEMRDKVENAEKEAARRASEEAALQRMRDQARFQEEMERRKNMEDQLRAEASMALERQPIAEGDLAQEVDRLQKLEQRQRQEIDRLIKELDRTNRVWELKLAVMQRNFHALRDECYIRHSLQRQSAALHHATVGYAVSGASKSTPCNPTQKGLKPLPKIRAGSRSQTGSISVEPTRAGSSRMESVPLVSSSDEVPPPPSPTPSHVARPRSVHFDERPLNPVPEEPSASQSSRTHSPLLTNSLSTARHIQT